MVADVGAVITSPTLADIPLSDGAQSITLRASVSPAKNLIVVRLSAAWCGSCDWHYTGDRTLLTAEANARVRYVDVLLRDADNNRPTAIALQRVRQRVGEGATAWGDSSLAFYTHAKKLLGEPHLNLPAYVLLDGRTLEVRGILPAPDASALAYRLRTELEELLGLASPDVAPPPTNLGFEADTDAMLRAMKVQNTRIPDFSNAYADRSDAARLGEALFHDATLSPSGSTSCASCHDAAHGFADPRPVSVEAGVGHRNAPSLLTSARRRQFFWDGRADALWTQALSPFENDREFASARGLVVKRAISRAPQTWAAIFGEAEWLPEELALVADDARPGRASWQALSAPMRARVNRSYVNVGKAIAAFERTLATKPTRFDAYLDGDAKALSNVEREGLSRFVINGCAQCHWGPDLTDDAYHVLRFPSPPAAPDGGRIDGLRAAASAAFTVQSAWSDVATARPHGTAEEQMHGAFKTPSLRGIADTAPYGHAGNLATLEDVLKLYSEGGGASDDPHATGQVEPWVTKRFHVSDIPPMAAFLRVFTEK